MVAKIKLQIKSFFRNNQTRKQNKGEQKTQTNVVQDPHAIQINDPAKLNYKSAWIKFTVKNLYEWYKHR